MRRIALLIGLIIMVVTFVPALAQQDCDPAVDHVVAGKTYQANGSFTPALNSFNCALALRPENAAAILNLRGNVYRQSGNLQQALADYDQAIALADDQSIIFNNRGWTYYLLENYDAALLDFDHALELNPELAYAYNNRGLVNQIKGNDEQAVMDFLQAIDLNHEPLEWPQHNLEQMLNSMETLADSAAVIPTTPDQDLFTAGATAYQEGRYDDAIENFTTIIEDYPDSTYLCCSYFYRGSAYMELGETELALADFNAFIERDPSRPGGYLTRASGYAMMGETVKAAEDFYTYTTLNSIETVDSGALELLETVTVDMTLGSSFVFTFEAEAGQQISIEVRDDYSDSQVVDPLAVVIDSEGQALIGDDDSGGMLDAYLIFTAPEAGTYQLVVHHAMGGSEGAVTVMLCTPTAQV